MGLVICVGEMGKYRRMGMDFREHISWCLYQETS